MIRGSMWDGFTMILGDSTGLYNTIIFSLLFVNFLWFVIEIWCATHDDDDT
jgi:hypothetical protein